MKQLLLIAAGVVLLIAAPLVLWRIFDNPVERKTEPLLGKWLSTFDDRTLLTIHIAEEGSSITVHHAGDGFRHGRTYPLHYDTALHYMDENGRRVDLFYSSKADMLLLMPGGTFRRIVEQPAKNEN